MMPARGQATFGDALIFITKALFATVALVIVAVTAYAVLATWTTTEQKLSEAHAQILTREDTIAELGEKLNACLVRTGSAPSGAELKAPDKPWERDWSPPDPPEGFVVDQPNPFEAELRRREDSSAEGSDDTGPARQTDGVRQFARGNRRAPHKPLLLLYALARIKHDRPRPRSGSTRPRPPCSPLLRLYGPWDASARVSYHSKPPRRDGMVHESLEGGEVTRKRRIRPTLPGLAINCTGGPAYLWPRRHMRQSRA